MTVLRGLLAASLSILTIIVGGAAIAKPRLSEIFTDHAVLQRGQTVEIWGTARPLEQVTVTVADQSVETTTDQGGNWRVKLPPMSAGGPYLLSVANKSGEKFLRSLRKNNPPIIARTENDKVLLDPRTVLPEQEGALLVGLKNILKS